jgi:hypothetical protein
VITDPRPIVYSCSIDLPIPLAQVLHNLSAALALDWLDRLQIAIRVPPAPMAEAIHTIASLGYEARVMREALTAQALSQDRLGQDLLRNLLQLCQSLLLPRDLQRYESRVRSRLLQSL